LIGRALYTESKRPW